MPHARFQAFHAQPATEALPERFTFPFHYEPHPLAIRAAEELQAYLRERDWVHDFGRPGDWQKDALGKMFGVLVVRTNDGTIGYLRAFSGRLDGTYDLPPFVPPVYDLYAPDGFFAAGEAELNAINDRVAVLEAAPDLVYLRSRLAQVGDQTHQLLADHRARMRRAKAERDQVRSQTDPADLSRLEIQLREESAQWRYRERDLKRAVQAQLGRAQAWVDLYDNEIQRLRKARRRRSAELQDRLFAHYTFLNAAGERKSVGEIFAETPLQVPPSGAGECCAPKLLQFAFAQKYEPIALAEFWWGQSPPDLIRHHGQYYPACRGKCEPILGHMLSGIALEDNPLLRRLEADLPLPIIYEDDYLLAVDKPGGLLSVPGRQLQDSVWLRLKQRTPNQAGPFSVHRLDMATSGILLLAKTAEAHRRLQAQFAERKVEKTYLALLDGAVKKENGRIELSMRFDYLNRPRQIVCNNGGKAAITDYEVVERYKNRKTLVRFFPRTGRTHQLRVHAAHARGLAAPIVGDRLYGKGGEVLMLRAEALTFTHPVNGEIVALALGTNTEEWVK